MKLSEGRGKLRVISVKEGAFAVRLRALGVYPGVVLTVVKKNRSGAMIVDAEGCVIAMRGDAAALIEVEGA